jgi:hypothetical protein
MSTQPSYVASRGDTPRDAWLYEAKPKKGCPRCGEEAEKLRQAIEAGDASGRFEAARNIRKCKHEAKP